MNNKGFMRILESIIAIIIIFMFTYYIIPKNTEKSNVEEEKIKSIQKTILNEISLNEEFRSCVLTDDSNQWISCKTDIMNYMENLNPRYRGKMDIVKCDIAATNCEECGISGNDIYVSNIFITGNSKERKVIICTSG